VSRTLLPGWTMPALASGDAHTTAESITAASTRLLDAISHLEKRIVALEHTAAPPLNDVPSAELEHVNDGADGEPTVSDASPSDKAARVTLLLGKGQSLLNLEKNEEAIDCFDKVIELDENNTDALVKKGVALERLRKLSEAIEYYDRAIAADSSITIAYLYKGGIYNRLERFSEALECYEKALRTQEKRRSS
jgi:tetratricopeptide (TPR) repeat protein